MDDFNTMNQFLVAAQGDGLRIMNPPRGIINKAQALKLIAYLVTMSRIEPEELEAAIDAVAST